MFCEAMAGATVAETEVAFAVGEMIELGVGMDVLIMGADDGRPVALRVVWTVPSVFGLCVLSAGRI